MSMALFIGLCHSRFSCFYPDFKRRCWGGRSHTSLAPIVHQCVARPVTSLCSPLVASSDVSVCDLAMLESPASEDPTPKAWEVPVLVMPGADGASQGTACVEVDGASPHLSDDIGGLLRDLVKRGAGIDVPGVLPWVMWPQPPGLRHRGSEGVWTAPAMLPQLSTPAYRLEACGRQSRVYVFTGHYHREVAT
jgi:hypothetical protein